MIIRRPRKPGAVPVAFVGIAVAVIILVLTAAPALAGPAPPPGTPTAVRFTGLKVAGAIFNHGLSNAHTCSASVVQSPGHDLVLTAGHCIAGTGAGTLFVPGYVDGRAPYGIWSVIRAWVAPTWLASQDPRDDYAFLKVASHVINNRRVDVQDVTGGAVLGTTPAPGTRVTDVAYPRGLDDEPITCSNAVVATTGYPTFNCHGYPGGTSGSPFLSVVGGVTKVLGVIGGLNQGGCYEWNSFSAPFGARTLATYQRAWHDMPGDTVPTAGPSGC